MRLFQVLTFSLLFINPIFAQDLLYRLKELGLDGFARLLVVDNPTLIADICNRNDITVWAPGNARVAARLTAVKKRQNRNGSGTSGNISAPAPTPNSPLPPGRKKREAIPAPAPAPAPNPRQHKRPPVYPDTNFEVILTFLNDSNGMNLGYNQRTPFTKNYASALHGGSNTASITEVVSGLGDTQYTIRGPFTFANGVIFEVSDFFTLPHSFTATMEHMELALQFYNLVVSSGKLSVFEESTAVTIFAPIDANCPNAVNPDDYIIGPPYLAYSPALWPDRTYITRSGHALKVTWAPGGGRLVNGRRIVKANVPIKNGVIHFIDGPLF